MNGPWFPFVRPRPAPALRLFLLPYAGAGASTFRPWSTRLPDWIEPWAVQLPGRETRFAEPSATRLDPLVESLADALSPWLDRPYALFGHSMGGLLAFELARTLRDRRLPLPRQVVVSGHRAPQVVSPVGEFRDLPEPEFQARLRALGGIPDAVWAEPQLVAMVSARLRADYQMLESYRYRPAPPLESPLTAYGAPDDAESTPELMAPWAEHSTRFGGVRLFSGGHFFIHHDEARVLADLISLLGQRA